MSYKFFLSAVISGTLVSWLGWYLIISNTSPESAGGIVGLFYLTLALSLFGTTTALGLIARRLIIRDDTALLRHLKQSLRQSLLATGAVLLTLLLLSANLFAWWIGAILIAALVLIEAIFYSRRTVTSGYV